MHFAPLLGATVADTSIHGSKPELQELIVLVVIVQVKMRRLPAADPFLRRPATPEESKFWHP